MLKKLLLTSGISAFLLFGAWGLVSSPTQADELNSYSPTPTPTASPSVSPSVSPTTNPSPDMPTPSPSVTPKP